MGFYPPAAGSYHSLDCDWYCPGVYSAARQYKFSDRVITGYSYLVYIIPAPVAYFVVQQGATTINNIAVANGGEKIFFVTGISTPGLTGFWEITIDMAAHYIVPTFCMTIFGWAGYQIAHPQVRRFLRNKSAVFGLSVFIGMGLFGLFGKYLTKYKPNDIDYMALGEGPSADHWFGTTIAGNDVFAMMVEAVWTSLEIGVIVGFVTVFISAVYGCVMAYFGGWIDKIMLFILETLIMVPSLLILAILINGQVGKQIQKSVPTWILLSAVLITFGWMGSARVIRAMAQSLINRDFVKAARYMGVHPSRL